MTKEVHFIPGMGERFIERPTLGSTQFPIEQMLSLVSKGVKWPGCEADFSYLVPAFRMY